MRLRPVTISLAGALAVLALTPALALANTSATIEEVQGAPGELTIVVSLNEVPVGAQVNERDVTASVEGVPLDVRVESISETSDLKQTAMLVMDTSDSMAGDKLDAAKVAASDFVAGVPDDVAVGLITFDNEARVVVKPTDDRADLDSAINQLTTAPKTLLYDAVVLAADQLASTDVASALLLSDGADRGSAATLEEAVAAVEDSRARFDVVSFDQNGQQNEALTAIGEAGDGSVVEAQDAVAELGIDPLLVDDLGEGELAVVATGLVLFIHDFSGSLHPRAHLTDQRQGVVSKVHGKVAGLDAGHVGQQGDGLLGFENVDAGRKHRSGLGLLGRGGHGLLLPDLQFFGV